MISIRKLGGYTGAVTVVAIAALFAMQAHAGIAQTPRLAAAVLAQPTPSAACTAARQALKTAQGADATEDASERAAAKTNPDEAADSAEDKTEKAAMKTLRDAVRQACEPQKPAPSAQCVAARQALKDAKAQDRIEDKSEKDSHPSADADKVEDQTEKKLLAALRKAEAAACGKGKH